MKRKSTSSCSVDSDSDSEYSIKKLRSDSSIIHQADCEGVLSNSFPDLDEIALDHAAVIKLYRKTLNKEKEDPATGHVGTERWIRSKRLGGGSFSVVYEAFAVPPCTKFPPIMAVKSSEFLESFELARESILLKEFRDCPYILDTYGSDVTVDEDGRRMFNVFLEKAEMGTAHDWDTADEELVRKFTESVLKGLDYIHKLGFVHCDIKPENIFIANATEEVESSFVTHDPMDDYVAKIGDFGLAKRASKGNVMKRSEFIMGTGRYMSPEIERENIQEQPSDIWALGCSVLQMLTGMAPWHVNSERKSEWDDAVKVPILPKDLSRLARDFLDKCFLVNPLERYTAEMLLQHPFVCNSVLDSTPVVPSRVICQEPTAGLPLMGAA